MTMFPPESPCPTCGAELTSLRSQEKEETVAKGVSKLPWSVGEIETRTDGIGRVTSYTIEDADGRVVMDATNSSVAEIQSEHDGEPEGNVHHWDEQSRKDAHFIVAAVKAYATPIAVPEKEKEEPVAWQGRWVGKDSCSEWDHINEQAGRSAVEWSKNQAVKFEMRPVYATPIAVPAQAQEAPVAWRGRNVGKGWSYLEAEDFTEEQAREVFETIEPLYATPIAVPPEREGWQPIETAPKDETRVLLAKAGKGYVTMGRWVERFSRDHYVDGEHGWFNDATQTRIWNPTHWMPLPEAPRAMLSSAPEQET